MSLRFAFTCALLVSVGACSPGRRDEGGIILIGDGPGGVQYHTVGERPIIVVTPQYLTTFGGTRVTRDPGWIFLQCSIPCTYESEDPLKVSLLEEAVDACLKTTEGCSVDTDRATSLKLTCSCDLVLTIRLKGSFTKSGAYATLGNGESLDIADPAAPFKAMFTSIVP